MTTKQQAEAIEPEYLRAIGRRKEATAQVRLHKNGTGKITVNGRTLDAYFPTYEMRTVARAALEAAGQSEKLDVTVLTHGGGMRAQADALRLGIARALCLLNPTFRRALKKVGHLTRDPRVKERKKPGLKRARKASQWAKR